MIVLQRMLDEKILHDVSNDSLGMVHTLSMKIARTSGERSARVLGASLKPSSSALISPGDPVSMQRALRQASSPKNTGIATECTLHGNTIKSAVHYELSLVMTT